MKTELVITSDDLGMSLSVNRGIEKARDLRALTSTNVMVPCPWFEHAAGRFGGADIDLGVHLTLTCEWTHYKWRPLTYAPSLLDANGCMHRTVRDLMERADPDEIRNECRAQIETALRRGLPISYVDVHMCLPRVEQTANGSRIANLDHELPLLGMVDEIAREFALPYPYAITGDQLQYFRSTLSISGKGRDVVAQYLSSLEPGIHHLSCHCAVGSDEQASLSDPGSPEYPWSLAYRAEDLECITSAWFRELLATHEVSLVRMPFTVPATASRAMAS